MHELKIAPSEEATSSPQMAGEQGGGRSAWASVGAVIAAFGASLCCIGPLLFVTFGVGAGLASTFEPLRPLFTALTVLGLGIGFYTVYGRKPKAQVDDVCCAPADACAPPRSRTRDQVLLWGATLLAVLFWSFNYWSILLI